MRVRPVQGKAPWETSPISRRRSWRWDSRAEVIRLKAALILPSSSDEVTGSLVLSPWAIAWVAFVSAVTGAVIRFDSQAASRMMASTVLRNPWDSVDRKSWFTST